MKYIVANIVFNLCYGELYEVGEVARLEVILVEDEIAYHRSIWDASPSITVLDTSTSDPGPSTRWDVIGPPHTCMDITDPSSSWGDPSNSYMSALSPFTSWRDN